MLTEHLFIEISKLPRDQRLFLAEMILHEVRKEELSSQMAQAAEELAGEYVAGSGLTDLTDLDTEDFYETK